MPLFGVSSRFLFVQGLLLIACSSALAAPPLLLDGESRTVPSLKNTQVKMMGRSELHITDGGNPAQNSKFELNSEDAWLFFHNIRPSEVADDVLKQIKVNGRSASLNKTIRVVQYGEGTVVVPHPADFKPLEVFSEPSYTGRSEKLEQYTEYDAGSLGSMDSSISSFILKRGYMATFAENEDGTGHSKCYVAQDFDLEVGVLPEDLNDKVSFVRVFPWRWTSKKGGANQRTGLNLSWWYNWNLNENSSLDLEYVAIKQKRNWPGLDEDWQARGINHLLGFNEPDKEDQANISVETAIEGWPELLKTGLRVGSPAITDSGEAGKGTQWLYKFMDQAAEKNYRVDFVAVHYYRSFWKPDDPEGAARNFHNFLKEIHDKTGKSIWITEWNNGANWTDKSHKPTAKQQKNAIEAMLKMLDETPFVERYSIYNWVEDVRRVQWDDGSLTAAGEVYRDKVSPVGFRQPSPEPGGGLDARYLFNGDFCDASGNGNNPQVFGSPRFSKVGNGQCLEFDGENDCLRLPARVGGDVFDSSGEFGFAGWIRWAGDGKSQRIFDFGDGVDRCYYLTPNSEKGTLAFVVRKGGKDHVLGSMEGMKPGVWTHVALSVSSSGAKLYINGKLTRESPSVSLDSADFRTRNNYIGRGQSAEPFFRGQIFEAHFLSHALSDREVAALATRVPIRFSENEYEFRATAGNRFSNSLADKVSGGKGKLAYAKVAGPAWLEVEADGALSGRPDPSDKGVNAFLVTVSDAAGHLDAAKLLIDVRR